MRYTATQLEEQAILQACALICAAARTAPKAKGEDVIVTLALTGAEKDALAARMDAMAEEYDYGFFHRDAQNVRDAQALVLIGAREGTRGLGRGCGYCHMGDCAGCAAGKGLCAYDPLDVGIALGSAAAKAADLRIDNRILFSVGRAAIEAQTLGAGVTLVYGMPLSISGKSPFFDRKPKK